MRGLSEYNGKYVKEIKGSYSIEYWVNVPKEQVEFLHKATLFGDDILSGAFVEDGTIYLMCWVFEEGNFYKCALDFVRKSNYKTVEGLMEDKKKNQNGYIYYVMDSLYYNEWCNKNR